MVVFVQVILLCFSTGSEKRSYTTFTANKEAYTTNSPVSESAETSWITPSYLPQWPPASWIERTAEEPWAYLLEPPRTLGTLICVTRGKLIALAAGNVSQFVPFWKGYILLKFDSACSLHKSWSRGTFVRNESRRFFRNYLTWYSWSQPRCWQG